MQHSECVFCQIVAGDAPAIVLREWPDAIAIIPINPVVEGSHVLIIPRTHVRDMLEDPIVTGLVATRAAEFAREVGWMHGHFAYNLGEYGGQTVDHLHGHQLRADEQTRHTMPWTGQQVGQ